VRLFFKLLQAPQGIRLTTLLFIVRLALLLLKLAQALANLILIPLLLSTVAAQLTRITRRLDTLAVFLQLPLQPLDLLLLLEELEVLAVVVALEQALLHEEFQVPLLRLERGGVAGDSAGGAAAGSVHVFFEIVDVDHFGLLHLGLAGGVVI
jgi:hypothetical protein